MQYNRKYLVFAILLALISGVIFFGTTYNRPLELYPENQTFFEFEVVSNVPLQRGFATMPIDPRAQNLHFRYNYQRGGEYPSSILIFHAGNLRRHIELSNFEYIDIEIDPKFSNDITVSMYFYIPGFSDLAHPEMHRPFSVNVRVQDDRSHYRFRLNENDFATPIWWLSHFITRGDSIPETDWNNFTHLIIANYSPHDADTSLQVVLKSLRFADSIPKKATNAAIFTFFVFAFLFVFLPKIGKAIKNSASNNIKGQSASPISATGKPSKYTEDTAQILFEYIDKNISNPLLSLELINKEAGISSFVVNEILKDKKDMQYKNYLDNLRINEAKRMLTETEHQISVIAEQVGYCYSNSFSRIFGKYCGMTPNEYRKKFGK
ncbi:MAG: AraC family transcriptional regulator [Chitinivibrionia bacterium]|nr:AraC family transcriptional regulator [Chitinivibrionia bacterium]